MKRLLLTAALLTGLIGFASLDLEAQTKKDFPKKGEPAKKEAAAGAVEIYKGAAGMRYRVVDAEGKTIAMPPPAKHWETKEQVIKAIDELKETLNKSKPVDAKE